ncbi:hypothetical protein AKJ36_02025 [candidate division MSBL1 archaeon SCGC-AAA259I07]|uniref:Aldolase n=1 Tax=candidate division MSBL1 archaeon SCGC-AAA259I07 TaxID=1698266 RepID=A0A133UKY2_9EURY|nr:hypothetical protein AKJ36_02025 [candidate division MSBL1 archaeon SCGC-AAA259I07]
MSGYEVEIIKPEEKDRLIDEEYRENFSYGRKANLSGMCIKLLTNVEEFKEMWEDNFKSMNEDVRPHGRIFALKTGREETQVLYEPVSKTCFLLDCDYYGYVKSLALAVSGDFLEEYHSIHSRYSVHGAAVDYKGVGTAIIAPSGVGKTTQAYGLILEEDVRLIADDWFYTIIVGNGLDVQASEKNCYIRVDIASDIEEYKELLKGVSLDSYGRAVTNVRRVLGEAAMKENTTLRNVIHLKRDPEDDRILRKVETDEAMRYILKNNFCNPHRLITDSRKRKLRKEFFEKLYERTTVYMVNTTATIQENLEQIKDIALER